MLVLEGMFTDGVINNLWYPSLYAIICYDMLHHCRVNFNSHFFSIQNVLMFALFNLINFKADTSKQLSASFSLPPLYSLIKLSSTILQFGLSFIVALLFISCEKLNLLTYLSLWWITFVGGSQWPWHDWQW